jgi:streptomycin 6-kinase
LKVSWLDESNADEALALTTWNGEGAVRLLAVEPAQGALLLERLDQRRSLHDLPVDEALEVAGGLLRRLAIPASVRLRPLSTLAVEIAHILPERWTRYGQPMSHALLNQACDLALRHGATAANLLVNYDLHYDNILAGQREPWLAIDPKVVLGDPEFGIMQLFMNRLEEIEATGGLDRHFPRLVAAAELDETVARNWTLVRCVDYWLWGLSVGLTEDPKRCAAILQWLG